MHTCLHTDLFFILLFYAIMHNSPTVCLHTVDHHHVFIFFIIAPFFRLSLLSCYQVSPGYDRIAKLHLSFCLSFSLFFGFVYVLHYYIFQFVSLICSTFFFSSSLFCHVLLFFLLFSLSRLIYSTFQRFTLNYCPVTQNGFSLLLLPLSIAGCYHAGKCFLYNFYRYF